MLRRRVALGVVYGNLSKHNLETVEWKNTPTQHNTATNGHRNNRRHFDSRHWVKVSFLVQAVVFGILVTMFLCVCLKQIPLVEELVDVSVSMFLVCFHTAGCGTMVIAAGSVGFPTING